MGITIRDGSQGWQGGWQWDGGGDGIGKGSNVDGNGEAIGDDNGASNGKGDWNGNWGQERQVKTAMRMATGMHKVVNRKLLPGAVAGGGG